MSNSVIDMKNYSNKYQILKKWGRNDQGGKTLGAKQNAKILWRKTSTNL